MGYPLFAVKAIAMAWEEMKASMGTIPSSMGNLGEDHTNTNKFNLGGMDSKTSFVLDFDMCVSNMLYHGERFDEGWLDDPLAIYWLRSEMDKIKLEVPIGFWSKFVTVAQLEAYRKHTETVDNSSQLDKMGKFVVG